MKYFNPGLMPLALFSFTVALVCVVYCLVKGVAL